MAKGEKQNARKTHACPETWNKLFLTPCQGNRAAPHRKAEAVYRRGVGDPRRADAVVAELRRKAI